MATALYRRYRPESFADVIGQEHVTEPLMQALRTGRVNHAYLFSGPRGCGKTTSARILARCLNCEQGPTPTPCGTCDSCVALSRGGAGSVDVIEIDAASHGGVDDARDLRERASYGPAQSRYKIYIIDEAHMVSRQGFNALLKIVEEPPEHVKFIFATTEPEQVIGTIRSRTHHYPFRLVPPAKLGDYMQRLCDQEKVRVAPGVLSFVTRAGGGSVRDSLSVLDQLIAGSGDDGLTYDGAVSLLGFTDAELLDATIDALAAGDGAATFRQVDKVIESGHDPRRFVEDLLERLRDLIIVAAVPEGAGQVLRGVPEDQLERMRQQQAAFGQGTLSRAADIVNAGLTEMTGANSPRLQLELICARILLPAASGDQGYAARLDRLERRLDVGGVPSAARSAGPAAPHGPAAAPGSRGSGHSQPPAGMPLSSPPPGSGLGGGREGSHVGTPGGGPAGAPMSAPTRTVVDRTPPRSSVSPIAGESGLTAGGMGGNGRSGNIEHLVGPDSSSGPPERPREQPAEQRTEQSDQHPSEHSAGRPADHAAERPAEPRQAAEVDAARAEAGAPPVAVPTESVGGPSAVDDPAITDAAASAQPGPPASGGMDTDAIRRAWPDVLGRIFGMRRATWTFVSQHAQVLAYDGSTLTLGIGTVGLTNTFRSGNHAELVRQALIDELGVDARVDGVPLPEGGAAQAAVPPPGSGPGPDAGPDAGRDAGRDAGPGRGDGGGGPSGGSSGGAPGAGSSAGDPGSRGGSWSQGGGSDGAHTAPPTGRTGPPPGAAGGPPPSAGGWGSPGGGRSLENNPGWGSVTAPAPEWATAGPAGASPAASAVTSGPPQFTSSQSEPAAPPASRSGQSTSSAAASTGQASADAPRPSRGASAVRESIAQARAGTGQPAGEEPAPVTGDDSAVSDDDEDIEVSGDVGRTVVERVFGGRVLSETSD